MLLSEYVESENISWNYRSIDKLLNSGHGILEITTDGIRLAGKTNPSRLVFIDFKKNIIENLRVFGTVDRHLNMPDWYLIVTQPVATKLLLHIKGL